MEEFDWKILEYYREKRSRRQASACRPSKNDFYYSKNLTNFSK